MQTFLPYPSFVDSATCLDNKRLGKQRVETLQILRALTIPEYGWKNHPAVRMWRGYGASLCHYGFAICNAWIIRGFADTCMGKIAKILGPAQVLVHPPWLGAPEFHASHRAALLAKNPDWYSKFGWPEEPKIEYIWPV